MFTPDDDRLMHDLVDVFLEENKHINLSAFRTHDQCYIGNILDSVAFLKSADEVLGREWRKQKLTLLDIGTGGGFPLLPLAMLMPQVQCVGLDAVRKKVDAVRRIVAAMKIANMEIVCGRAEEYGRHPQFRGQFDIVTARAVAPLNVLLEFSIPFLKTGGVAVFWKSLHIAEELRSSLSASNELKAKLSGNYTYELPMDWGERTIIVFKKTDVTPDEYPRRTGVPKMKPL